MVCVLQCTRFQALIGYHFPSDDIMQRATSWQVLLCTGIVLVCESVKPPQLPWACAPTLLVGRHNIAAEHSTVGSALAGWAFHVLPCLSGAIHTVSQGSTRSSSPLGYTSFIGLWEYTFHMHASCVVLARVVAAAQVVAVHVQPWAGALVSCCCFVRSPANAANRSTTLRRHLLCMPILLISH